MVRALKTGSREAWHIGFRCDVTFYLDGIVLTYASHLGRSGELARCCSMEVSHVTQSRIVVGYAVYLVLSTAASLGS